MCKFRQQFHTLIRIAEDIHVDRRGIGTPLAGWSASKRDPSDVGVHLGSRVVHGGLFGMLVVETIARIRRAHFGAGQVDQGDLPGAACAFRRLQPSIPIEPATCSDRSQPGIPMIPAG